MKKHKFTYEKSGVNITAADNFVKFISKISSKNNKNIGGFGSISNIPKKLNNPTMIQRKLIMIQLKPIIKLKVMI